MHTSILVSSTGRITKLLCYDKKGNKIKHENHKRFVTLVPLNYQGYISPDNV